MTRYLLILMVVINLPVYASESTGTAPPTSKKVTKTVDPKEAKRHRDLRKKYLEHKKTQETQTSSQTPNK